MFLAHFHHFSGVYAAVLPFYGGFDVQFYIFLTIPDENPDGF